MFSRVFITVRERHSIALTRPTSDVRLGHVAERRGITKEKRVCVRAHAACKTVVLLSNLTYLYRGLHTLPNISKETRVAFGELRVKYRSLAVRK